MGVKGKLLLVSFLAYFLDTTYRVVLQALGISHSKLSTLQKIPQYVLFWLGVCGQACLLTKHFCQQRTRRQQMALFLQITVPCGSILMLSIAVKSIIYLLYINQSKESKLRLVIALFAPLVGVLFKSDLPTFCSAVREHYSSGIFVCLVSAIVLCFSDYVPNATSRS